MTVPDIITLARKLTHTTEAQIDNTTALQYLNIAYHDIENSIVTKVDEDFFWDTFTTDTVGDQNEYIMPITNEEVNGIRKVIDCRIKRSADDAFYSKIPSNSSSNFDKGVDYLRSELDRSSAFYELKEGSVFVFPQPDSEIVGGLKLDAIVALKDLSYASPEESLFPNQSTLRQFHYVLAIGMKQYIYSQQREFGEKDNAIQEYNLEKQKVLDYLEDRTNSPMEGYLPQGTNFY